MGKGKQKRARPEPLGEQAFVLKVAAEAGDRALRRVRSIARRLERQAWPDGVEIVPALISVAVVFEDEAIRQSIEGRSTAAWMEERLLQALAEWQTDCADADEDETSERLIELPVCYGGLYGPDLPDVAAHCGIAEEEVVRLHTQRTYRVGMLGFLPGFPYLLGLDERLHTPRRDVPRVTVPNGAVGIGGAQTGVYPVASPGGWQLIGRTPARLLDAERKPPSLLEAGDLVRFVPVPEEQFEALAGREPLESKRRSSKRLGEGCVEIVSAGLLTTVQDGGRVGYRRYGVPRSGALDLWALRTANALVGNEPCAAGLECTLLGPELRFGTDVLFAVCGGEFGLRLDGEPVPSGRPVRAPAGSALTVGRAASGCRAYVAFAGGIDVPPALDSRSTDVRSGLGGLQGRALQPGDALPLGAPSPVGDALLRLLQAGPARWGAGLFGAAGDAAALRFVRGPEWAALAPESAAVLAAQPFAVQPASDRMGYRLHGTASLQRRGAAREMVSEPVLPGTVQLPPSGQPLLLLADGQTTGGYPRIAQVAQADLGVAAQLRPGDKVRFVEIAAAEAEALQRARWLDLRRLQAAIRSRLRDG